MPKNLDRIKTNCRIQTKMSEVSPSLHLQEGHRACLGAMPQHVLKYSLLMKSRINVWYFIGFFLKKEKHEGDFRF